MGDGQVVCFCAIQVFFSLSLTFFGAKYILALYLLSGISSSIRPFSSTEDHTLFSFADDCLSLIVLLFLLITVTTICTEYIFRITIETCHSAVSICQHHQLVLSHLPFLHAPLSPLSNFLFLLLLIAMLTSKSFHSSEWPVKRHWTSKRLATAAIR